MIEILHRIAAEPWYTIASTTVTLASLVAAVTPVQWDNAAARIARKGLDLLALNFRTSLQKGKP